MFPPQTSSFFDMFPQTQNGFDMFPLTRTVETSGKNINLIVPTHVESWLECVDRRLKDRLPEDTRNLYYICFYYHLIRNQAAHSGQEKREADRLIAFQRIDRNKSTLVTKFNKLKAPNQEDNIEFDDFVLFSRSAITLAEEYWKAIRIDYVTLIGRLSDEIIKKWNGHQNNPERLKKEIKRYLETNYALPEGKFADEIINAVESCFKK